MLIDAISGFVADFQQLIDVNAGGLWLKKGQKILHPNIILRGARKLPISSNGAFPLLNGPLSDLKMKWAVFRPQWAVSPRALKIGEKDQNRHLSAQTGT